MGCALRGIGEYEVDSNSGIIQVLFEGHCWYAGACNFHYGVINGYDVDFGIFIIQALFAGYYWYCGACYCHSGADCWTSSPLDV